MSDNGLKETTTTITTIELGDLGSVEARLGDRGNQNSRVVRVALKIGSADLSAHDAAKLGEALLRAARLVGHSTLRGDSNG